MKLALQPASLAVEHVARHYAATVVAPVNISEHEDLLSSETLDHLKWHFPSGFARMWCVVSGLPTKRLTSMKVGDVVAFYGEGRIYRAGRIAAIFHNPALAERLWGRDQRAAWEYVYAISHFDDVDVPIQEVRRVLGWSDKAVVVAFTLIDGEKASRLAKLCNLNLARELVPEWLEGRPREHAEWQTDTPADLDLLNREALAQVLATRLVEARRPNNNDPFLLHVDGPWGAGKTTLLKLLKSRLSAYDFLVVEFNSWRHVRVEPTWWPLMIALRKSVINSRSRGRRWLLRIPEAWMRFRYGAAPNILVAVLVLCLMLASFLLLYWVATPYLKVGSSDPNKAADTVSKWVTASAGLLALIGPSVVAVMGFSRFLMWDSPRRARTFEQVNSDPMNHVAAHFAWLLRKARRPVAIFVDDLDRCDEKYVVSLLEVIQNLVLGTPDKRSVMQPVNFVVAADGAWLRRAFEVSYETFEKAVAQPGKPLGYSFLDKMFQLAVPLPAVGAATRFSYLNSLLDLNSPDRSDELRQEAAKTLELVNTSASEADVLNVLRGASREVRELVAADAVKKMARGELGVGAGHVLERFIPLLGGNPRSIKRYINRYGVTRAVRTLEGNLVEGEVLALWVLLEVRWPHLADHLRHRPSDTKYIGNLCDDKSVPEGLRELFVSDDLLEVLNGVPVPLTAEVVRVCCGEFTPRGRE